MYWKQCPVVAIERGSVCDCDHVWTVVYDRLRFHRKMSRVQGGVSLFTIQVCYKNVYLLQLQFLLGFRDISPPLKDTFPFRPTYFWPMQNDLVYLGIYQTKFQTTAILRWGLITQWSAFHFMYHTSYFPESTHCSLREFVCIGSESNWLCVT